MRSSPAAAAAAGTDADAVRAEVTLHKLDADNSSSVQATLTSVDPYSNEAVEISDWESQGVG